MLVVDSTAKTVAVHRVRGKVQVLGVDDVLELPDLLPGWSLRVGRARWECFFDRISQGAFGGLG